MTKPTKESSLCAQLVAKDPSFLRADSEDSDQTGRMPRLIWVFAGRTLTLLVLSCRGSYTTEAPSIMWALTLLNAPLLSTGVYSTLSGVYTIRSLHYQESTLSGATLSGVYTIKDLQFGFIVVVVVVLFDSAGSGSSDEKSVATCTATPTTTAVITTEYTNVRNFAVWKEKMWTLFGNRIMQSRLRFSRKSKKKKGLKCHKYTPLRLYQ